MKGKETVIRDAVGADREEIRALTRTAYGEYSRLMAPTSWRGLSNAVESALETEIAGVQRIVAERQGRLVGSVMLFPPAIDSYGWAVDQPTWPELRLLAVADEARGSGVGRALVIECIRRSRAMGASALGLHTSRSMASAVALYEKLGFQRAPEFDFQPEGAELVTAYRLELSNPDV